MTLLSLLIMLVVVAAILWLVQTYMPEPYKKPTLAITVLLVLVFLVVKLWPQAGNIRVP